MNMPTGKQVAKARSLRKLRAWQQVAAAAGRREIVAAIALQLAMMGAK
jgi:hypothetical protein